MKISLFHAALVCLSLASIQAAHAANDVPVPPSCTPAVNQGIANLIASQTQSDVDNIMVCGTAVGNTRLQTGGPHGSHYVTTISVQLPNGQTVNVQVVTNDSLDGVITAQPNDQVFAYGQGYVMNGRWTAGVHDVHCSTHSGADNGWVAINGNKTPHSCPN
jgi:hypothetical protein